MRMLQSVWSAGHPTTPAEIIRALQGEVESLQVRGAGQAGVLPACYCLLMQQLQEALPLPA